METLESSRVCRLCGKQSGISIDIFDKKESHVKKINAVLPILVHEMDMLPKHMCHRCSYKLEEFHKFYVDCLKTDADFKSQLSWMRKEDSSEEVGVPMVQIENINIKTEPPNYDIYELDPIVDNVNYINSMRSVTFPVNNVHNRTVIPCTVDDTEKRCGFAYSTFSNYAHCKCACDKSNRTKEAVLKDCTKMRCRYSINKNLGTTNADDTVPTSNTKNSSILDNILQDTRRKDDLLETSIDAFNGHPSKNTRKQSYITTKDIFFPSTDDITNLCSNGNKESKGDVRILRPRKRSVDYIGTKKKSSSTSRMNTQSRARSADTKQAVSSETHDINFAKVKEERIDNFEGRTLRPRKNSIDYMGTKRKHSSQSGVNSVDRSRSEECHSKRHRSCGGNAGTPNSIACMGGKQDTSTEAVDLLVKKEIFADEGYPTPTPVTNAKVQLETRTRHYVKNLSNQFDELSKNITIKVEKGDTDCKTRNSKSLKKNSSFVVKSKSLIKVTKNKLKSSRATVKRTPNKTVCYSPKYLRSHDVHLRNGKVKNLEPSDRRIRKNLKKELWRFTARKEIIKTVKVPASRKSLDSIKQFCEKCSLSFVNKEVFRLHACYYD